ncbi:hypothetical protein [Neobacillus cucumis]|nr:hypothetical protein [Neobacillus cucumis]
MHWILAFVFLLVGVTVVVQGYRMNEKKRRKDLRDGTGRFAGLPLWLYK